MSKMPSKRNAIHSRGGKKEPAFARKAVQHQDFIGQAEPQRAEAAALKQERVEHDHEQFVVEEMKKTLEDVVEKSAPVLPLRKPTSIRDGISMLKETASPETFEKLRAKAEERLAELPRPLQLALEMATRATHFLAAPVGAGVKLVSALLKTPAAMVRMLARRPRQA
jgi:hypothetical protein